MIHRIISKEILKTRKSVLLLGPRQVGKSTLIQELKPELEINLADENEYLHLASQSNLFRESIAGKKTIYVDEIQRLPKLLNTIQAIIDKDKSIKFYLTGSSARKLRRGEANLLPGRVLNFNLGPLVSKELAYQMNTQKALELGTLPEPYVSSNKLENERLLKSYAANYLKEEIKAEALVRNLESFARFFAEVTLHIAEFIDYTKLAQKSKISRHAIPRYFEILEDTLIAYRIHPLSSDFHQLDLIKHPKFYFFDNGVYNGMLGNFKASPDRVGKLAEQLVFSQILHSAWACEKNVKIHSFCTRQGLEVDFVLELDQDLFALEVKNSPEVIADDLTGLRFFEQTISAKKKLFLLHMGKKEAVQGKIAILPWQKGLQEMGL